MTISDQIYSQWLASLSSFPSLLKVLAFFVAWVTLWLPLAVPLAVLFKWRPFKPVSVAQKLSLVATLYLIVPAIVWGASWIEGASLFDYGFNCRDVECNVSTFLISLLTGLGLGVLSIAALFAIEYRLAWVKWRWQGEQPSASTETSRQNLVSVVSSTLLPTLFLGLWIGGTEELVFRGFLLNELQQDYLPWVAAAISSLIFALLHLIWEQEKTKPQLPGLWLMGMVLVLARWADGGSLALAWGLHAGWVWAIASLDTSGIVSYTGNGPTWITGIGEKPLAGAAGLLCMLATGALLWSFYF